jgi:uncharacterized protein YuzE
MEIYYNNKTDLLYLRLDPRAQEVRNEDVGADIVLDIGDDDLIVGIEFLGASRRVNLDSLLPIAFREGSVNKGALRHTRAAG